MLPSLEQDLQDLVPQQSIFHFDLASAHESRNPQWPENNAWLHGLHVNSSFLNKNAYDATKLPKRILQEKRRRSKPRTTNIYTDKILCGIFCSLAGIPGPGDQGGQATNSMHTPHDIPQWMIFCSYCVLQGPWLWLKLLLVGTEP